MIIEYGDPSKKKMKKSTKKPARMCTILITCQAPQAGKMSVEMSYEGDAVLAMYLLENAQELLDQELLASANTP